MSCKLCGERKGCALAQLLGDQRNALDLLLEIILYGLIIEVLQEALEEAKVEQGRTKEGELLVLAPDTMPRIPKRQGVLVTMGTCPHPYICKDREDGCAGKC